MFLSPSKIINKENETVNDVEKSTKSICDPVQLAPKNREEQTQNVKEIAKNKDKLLQDKRQCKELLRNMEIFDKKR